MTPLPSLRAGWRWFTAAWAQYFFEPVDLRICAMIRMAFALLMLINLGVLGPNLIHWFGAAGLLRDLPLEEYLPPGSWSVLFWLPKTDAALTIAYGVALAQAVLLFLGLASRFQAFGCLVWLVSFQNSNPLLMDGEDAVFRLIAALLVFMPCGQTWSLDAWIGRRFLRRPLAPIGPAWSLKLLQIQMAIIFLDAFYMKIHGLAWQDGVALYYVSRLEDFFPRFPVPSAIFDSWGAIRAMTWGTLLIELGTPLFIWFRETRRLSLLAAVAFHLACDYSMNLFLFHWIMLVGWSAFLRPEDWRDLQSLIQRNQSEPRRSEARVVDVAPAPTAGEPTLAAFGKSR